MTLNTVLVLHQWTDPVELHTWFNREVLNVAHRNPIINQSETEISNQLGQGFDAIFEVSWEKDHGGLPRFPRGVIEICWDTAYGFTSDVGENCTMLHAKFITRLASEYLTPRGIGFSWMNEYTNEWHDGLDGLEAFIGQGELARAWYSETVLPAVAAMLTASENG